MSSRKLQRNPDDARRNEYQQIEANGEAQEALWEALATLNQQGIDIGGKARAVLQKRDAIKAKIPKPGSS